MPREVKRSLKWMMSIIKYVPKSHEKEDREERKGQIIKKSFFYAKDLKFYSEICKSY